VRTLDVGELVLTRFFARDTRAWRARSRNKNNSIRRLAEYRDCPFSRSVLNDAVAVYVASLALPCVRTLGHIAAAHVVAVLGLPALAREPLLHEASRDRLSVLPAPKDLEPDARERVGAVAAELLKVGGELRRQTSGGPTVAGAGKTRPFEPREQAAVGAE
jgi:hypothetical protein